MSELTKTRGKTLRIDSCFVGKNLNLIQIRGFTQMDTLADISGPDVYDQVSNPLGTQRDLLPKHAKEASGYATESLEADAESDPRAFPEVILNVRDESIIHVIVDGDAVPFTSLDSDGLMNKQVSLEISLADIKYPPNNKDPQISRLDGNHRLSHVPKLEEREDEGFPTIPFAIFIGLSKDQERKLFADINGTQVKMNTSHLSQIRMQLDGDKLLLDSKTRPLWFAKKLTADGAVFSDVVFKGGAKGGVRQQKGFVPPLNLATLKSMVAETLKKLEAEFNQVVSADLLDRAIAGEKEAMQQVVKYADMFLKLQGYYWSAIKTVYSDAWQDHKKRQYVLFQSVGTLALSRFGGDLIADLMNKGRATPGDFVTEVNKLLNAGLTLSKAPYEGFAGLAGATRVYSDIQSKYKEGSTGFRNIQHLLEEEFKSGLDGE